MPQLVWNCFRISTNHFIRFYLFLKFIWNHYWSKICAADDLTASHMAIVGSSPRMKIFQSHSTSRSANFKYLDSTHKAAEFKVIWEYRESKRFKFKIVLTESIEFHYHSITDGSTEPRNKLQPSFWVIRLMVLMFIEWCHNKRVNAGCLWWRASSHFIAQGFNSLFCFALLNSVLEFLWRNFTHTMKVFPSRLKHNLGKLRSMLRLRSWLRYLNLFHVYT